MAKGSAVEDPTGRKSASADRGVGALGEGPRESAAQENRAHFIEALDRVPRRVGRTAWNWRFNQMATAAKPKARTRGIGPCWSLGVKGSGVALGHQAQRHWDGVDAETERTQPIHLWASAVASAVSRRARALREPAHREPRVDRGGDFLAHAVGVLDRLGRLDLGAAVAVAA